jgi:hypothetical protein
LYDNGTSVGLGTITPDASAILELSSTTQGFATPRMTTLQRNAIVAPTIGLLIYNTSSSFFNYWDGSTWIQMDTSTGGDVSGSGTTNYAVKWTDGANSVIGDGTWAFSGNDYYPVTTGSNIGDATHRIGTIFMASVFDYANNLTIFNGTSTNMTLTTGGQLGIGITPTIPDSKLEVKVATDQRFNFRNVCNHCNGDGRKNDIVKLNVNLPHGISDGQFIKAGGYGNFSEGQYGDAILKINVLPQDNFEKSNDDLIYHFEMSINDFEKDTIDIPHPNGVINIKMPNEINTNHPLRIKNKGYHGQGDLYIKMFVTHKRV